MHRELSHADAVFGRPRVIGLYLFTGLLVLLCLTAPICCRSAATLFGLRFATIAAILGGARVLYRALRPPARRPARRRPGPGHRRRLPHFLIGEPLVAAEVVFIGMVGECLEAFTFGRTQTAVRKIVEIFPRRCWLLRDGQEVRVFTLRCRSATGRRQAGRHGFPWTAWSSTADRRWTPAP